MADACVALGRFDDAEKIRKSEIEANIKEYGADHLRVGKSYLNYSMMLTLQNRLEEAEHHAGAAKAIFLKQCGPRDPLLGSMYCFLYTIANERGRWDQAADYTRRALAIDEQNFGRDSVHWIATLFDKAGLPSVKLVQHEATEAQLRAKIKGRQFVHLACQGLSDAAFGNFFGALALTPGDKAGDASNDGFLTLQEIYELDMRRCDLAILSACMTNYGPQQRGEGAWALSRGVLVAGAKRVVASNWVVDDQAAASLISYFAGGVAAELSDHRAPDYAASLQAAKRWISEQEKWHSPFYWAGFVLVGSP
jgi:tetratricopeptide (TPR) repeat protein